MYILLTILNQDCNHILLEWCNSNNMVINIKKVLPSLSKAVYIPPSIRVKDETIPQVLAVEVDNRHFGSL